MNWSVPKEWMGETVFILACGPSLAATPVEHLKGKGRVIAINDAYQRALWADVVYIGDFDFLLEHQQKISDVFKGTYVVSLDKGVEDSLTVRNTGELGLETDPTGVRHGNNSGYAAINLAYHFGAKRIVLLGYDMSTPKGQLHWQHRKRMQNAAGFNLTLQIMLKSFPALVQPLADAGVEVINSTPNSALTCWPYAPLAEIAKQ